MTNKSKTSLILIFTLLIGVIIGSLITGFIRQQRVHRFNRMKPQEKFIHAMERIIKPTDDQHSEINRILEKYYSKIHEVREQHQGELLAIFDSLRNDIGLILTDEQKNRLEREMEKGIRRFSRLKLDKLSEELELSDKQHSQVEKIFANLERNIRKNFGDRRGFRGDRKTNMFEHLQKFHQEIESVLTPEQIEKFRESFSDDSRFWGRPFGMPGKGHRPDDHFRRGNFPRLSPPEKDSINN